MSSDAPDADSWRDLDSTGSAEGAVAYLDAAARILAPARHRSHTALAVGRGASVLDAGCGSGIALREIADLVGPDGSVTGLDPSAAILEEARRRLAGVAAAVELVQASVLDTGLPDERFDAVRTERVLMHVDDPAAAIAELARVTRPGGRVVLVEPDHHRLAMDTDDPELWSAFLAGFATVVPNIGVGLRAASDAVLAGLEVLSVEAIPYLFRSQEDFSAVFQLEMGRDTLLARGVAEERFDAFLAELDRRHAEGRFLAVGMMYVVAAGKR